MNPLFDGTSEDYEWLSMAENYIGYDKPQIRKIVIGDNIPSWVIGKFEKEARAEGITYYEFLDKYDPSFDPGDWTKSGLDYGNY